MVSDAKTLLVRQKCQTLAPQTVQSAVVNAVFAERNRAV